MERLREELTRREASPLLVQGIGQAIAVHLARNYSVLDKESRSGSPSLPGYKLKQIQGWMAEHLADEFDLSRLAARAGLSKFYFQRLFKSATGHDTIVLPHHAANGRGPTPASRNQEEHRGGRPGGRLREPQPLCASLPPGNRPLPERLPKAPLTGIASPLTIHTYT